MTFGTALRDRRTQVGLPQHEVAYRLDVSLRTYIRWEDDEIEPRLTEFVRLAGVLEVEPAELLKSVEAVATEGRVAS